MLMEIKSKVGLFIRRLRLLFLPPLLLLQAVGGLDDTLERQSLECRSSGPVVQKSLKEIA